MTAPSERHGPARPPSPDVEVAADTTVFTASAERAVTEGHGHASRCAPGPSLQERHGSEAAAGAAGCKIALSLQRAKAVGVRVFMLPQRKDSRRRFEQDGPPAIAAGEAAGDQPAMADKTAGGRAGGIIDQNIRPGAAGIEAQVRG